MVPTLPLKYIYIYISFLTANLLFLAPGQILWLVTTLLTPDT